MRRKISFKQVLVDLISIMPQIVNEFKDNIKYKRLVDFLNDIDYYNNEELPCPTSKQIEAEPRIKSYQLRKQFKEIYGYLFNYESDFQFYFRGSLDLIRMFQNRNLGRPKFH
ncbi:hypothetical protein [Psychroflexus planctonicus]|uniref:Uncharacterized protein n=1 Tax=Psychroflexus planctonicus TaxID=1526575 RepID=A0ABQ1SN41_9FLAO|nr:hypothetical protein [Psychroflexus planctonicus]GGE45014.1 hypothetical protein GCM10010832_26210 [Psychroflexus planctonicus]